MTFDEEIETDQSLLPTPAERDDYEANDARDIANDQKIEDSF